MAAGSVKTMKILIIYTGGTIGMKQTPSGLAPAGDLATDMRALAELGPAFQRHAPELDVLVYDPLIDSADMTPALWIKLAADIESRYDSYDGFVVLHGTDTLAYTSSALSFFVRRWGKPVVVTGAQLPFGFPRSDARSNLISAIEVACTTPAQQAQVCVVFGPRILRGCRVTKVSARAYDAFDSPRFPPLGQIGIEIRYPGARRQVIGKQPTNKAIDVPANDAVAVLQLFPGISDKLFSAVASMPGLRAIVLTAYGAGTGPSRDPAFLDAVRKAVASGIVVLVVSQPLDGVVDFTRYAAGSGLASAGAICGHDLTTEAAVTKLYYLIACGYDAAEIARYARHPLAGEMTV